VTVESSYEGPEWEGCGAAGSKPSKEFVEELVEHLREERRLHKKYVLGILLGVRDLLAQDRSLIDITVPEGPGGHFTVCGDTHGQFYDLLNIFEINGFPSIENPYLFNGATTTTTTTTTTTMTMTESAQQYHHHHPNRETPFFQFRIF
jgi:serine/threonine-protein phosphatase 5